MLNYRHTLTYRMKRMIEGRSWIYSSSLAIAAMIVLGGSVFAGGWCRADPIVEINGEEVQIWVMIPEEMESSVNGPIQIFVSEPWGTDANVSFLDIGFNDYGERVRFFTDKPPNADGSMDLQIFVTVPVDSSKLPSGVWTVPVKLEIVTDRGTTVVTGSHWWTSARATVGG